MGAMNFCRLTVVAFAALLGGCYTSETVLLTVENSEPIAGVSDGLYCHAEAKVAPPVVTTSPTISESLGTNQCRDLHWDAERGLYADRLSTSIELRTAPSDLPEFTLLQVQTGATAPARFAPVGAVDGLFIMYDPEGRWPEDIIAASGLTLDDQGIVVGADPEALRPALKQAFERALVRLREDLAFVEDSAGPRLEFRSIAAAYGYLVHFRKDWSGDTVKLRSAMLALADTLGLRKLDESWTEDPQ